MFGLLSFLLIFEVGLLSLLEAVLNVAMSNESHADPCKYCLKRGPGFSDHNDNTNDTVAISTKTVSVTTTLGVFQALGP